MEQRQLLFRAFVRAACIQAKAKSTTPKSILECIILGKFKTDATNGRTVVSTSEAGGSVSFMLPQSLGPADVMALAEEGIEWLELQTDPTAPDLTQFKRVRRLRATFDMGNVR